MSNTVHFVTDIVRRSVGISSLILLYVQVKKYTAGSLYPRSPPTLAISINP